MTFRIEIVDPLTAAPMAGRGPASLMEAALPRLLRRISRVAVRVSWPIEPDRRAWLPRWPAGGLRRRHAARGGSRWQPHRRLRFVVCRCRSKCSGSWTCGSLVRAAPGSTLTRRSRYRLRRTEFRRRAPPHQRVRQGLIHRSYAKRLPGCRATFQDQRHRNGSSPRLR